MDSTAVYILYVKTVNTIFCLFLIIKKELIITKGLKNIIKDVFLNFLSKSSSVSFRRAVFGQSTYYILTNNLKQNNLCVHIYHIFIL